MLKKLGVLKREYTWESTYQLFMVCAFPIHVWAILMAFSDFSWVADRTRLWDAVGLVSYALIFALIETVGVFVIVWLLGLLIPARWEVNRRVALLGSLFLVIAVWAMLSQLYFMLNKPLPPQVVDSLAGAEHPLRVMWGVTFPVLVLSVVVPAFAIIRSDRTRDIVAGIFERISVLSTFYVCVDLIGILIVLIRSVTV